MLVCQFISLICSALYFFSPVLLDYSRVWVKMAMAVSGFHKCTGAKYYYWSDFFHWSITITSTTILYPSYKIWGRIWSSFYCEKPGLFLILLYISWLWKKSLFVHHSPLYLLISGYQGVEFDVRINRFISDSSGQAKIEHICTVMVVSGVKSKC